MNTTDIRT